MRFTLPLHRDVHYSNVLWRESGTIPGVRYAIRRISVANRIELISKTRELAIKHEFLKAGDAMDQLEGSLADLLVRKLYLEWGLIEIHGLKINGRPATAHSLIEEGPERLAEEIVGEVRSELGLTEDERKNF